LWTEAHRARHEPRLKGLVAARAVEEVAGWLERADPPRSGRATPVRRVVGAIAWHLRIGGAWRALPPGWPPWRTVYGWFRRWLDLGLFDALLREVASRRRRKVGRRPGPTLGIVDTQTVRCMGVRGPRGYDAAKGTVGRKVCGLRSPGRDRLVSEPNRQTLWRKAASYAAQLVTRCRCLGMRWRRAALALNGTTAVQGSWEGPLPYVTLPLGASRTDPCNKVNEQQNQALADVLRKLADTAIRQTAAAGIGSTVR
jgi:transposase